MSMWPRKTRWPGGLVGMLGLLLAVECSLARLAPHLRNAHQLGYRFAGRRAANEASRADVLCFGDSQMKFGIAPHVVAARTGRPAYNLAIVGGQPPASYFLLRRALEAGARPSAVLFDCKANILSADYHWNVRNLPGLMDTRDAFDLAWTGRDASLFASLVLARHLPSYQGRDEVRKRDSCRAAGRTLLEPSLGRLPAPELEHQSRGDDQTPRARGIRGRWPRARRPPISPPRGPATRQRRLPPPLLPPGLVAGDHGLLGSCRRSSPASRHVASDSGSTAPYRDVVRRRWLSSRT